RHGIIVHGRRIGIRAQADRPAQAAFRLVGLAEPKQHDSQKIEGTEVMGLRRQHRFESLLCDLKRALLKRRKRMPKDMLEVSGLRHRFTVGLQAVALTLPRAIYHFRASVSAHAAASSTRSPLRIQSRAAR